MSTGLRPADKRDGLTPDCSPRLAPKDPVNASGCANNTVNYHNWLVAPTLLVSLTLIESG